MSEFNNTAKMGEFNDVAKRLAVEVVNSTTGRLRPEDIPDIISSGSEPVNCYPGIPGGCYQKAFFISLNSKIHGRNHLSFEGAIEEFLRHMRGDCKNVTKFAVIITDTWQPDVLFKRHPAIEQIKKAVFLEAYLIAGGEGAQIAI